DYTAIGDTVNVAARLEAATKEAGCDALASASTLALLADDPELRGLERVGDITVKGRRAPVDAYRLARPEPAAVSHDDAAELAA
ncbi:MAG: hypothetical protein JWM98_3040, partial [Thermoleophilia bacterium]|nr:hypothetical protein [Thermoleophilia bacterium]